jgi:Ca2+/Na+ antiporter
MVIAATIFSSPKDIQLEANSIYRDIGIYIIATSTVIVFGIIGELSVTSAYIMLAEYLMLVLVVCL